MGWSSRFIAALSDASLSPMFIFETIALSGMPGSSWRVVSHENLTGEPYLGDALQVGGASVALQSWRASVGAFTVRILADETVSSMLGSVVRGALCRVLMGFAGWGEGDFEPILLGQVRNISGMNGIYEIECHDILAALQSRLTTDGAKLALFYVPTGTVAVGVSATYTAGDATLNVTDTSEFYSETAAAGALKIIPTSGKDPFYLSYTGKTATTFTGLSATGQHGTTAVKARLNPTPSEVSRVALLTGHPFDIVRRILTSTGAGTNGTYDDYPAHWGFGLSQDLVDSDDIDRWRPVLSAHTWEFFVENGDTEIDALGWLTEHLADAGAWLVNRHGRISVRCAQDPEGLYSIREAFEITDDMIASIESWEAWDAGVPLEFGTTRAITATGASSTTETVGTMPAAEVIEYDVSDKAFVNEASVRSEMLARLVPWTCRVPEKVVLRLIGLAGMQLVPGDLITLSTSYASGRGERTKYGYDGRNVKVTEVSPDVLGGTVAVTLAIAPSWIGAMP